jgi:hypothetical protein
MFFRRIAFVLALALIIFVTYHGAVYMHEWVHGTVAYLTGYKSHPFNIDYGTQWVTLLDIDEAVPYERILADGKPTVVACIAIAPLICQMALFLLGLKWLHRSRVQAHRWLFACVYWFTFLQLAETYTYIPIRTFAPKNDVHNFVSALNLSPWFVAIPGSAFVFWGIYRFITVEHPRACTHLRISSQSGRIALLVTTVFLFFGYYGTPGIFMPDALSQNLAKISWVLVPLSLIALYLRARLHKF